MLDTSLHFYQFVEDFNRYHPRDAQNFISHWGKIALSIVELSKQRRTLKKIVLELEKTGSADFVALLLLPYLVKSLAKPNKKRKASEVPLRDVGESEDEEEHPKERLYGSVV